MEWNDYHKPFHNYLPSYKQVSYFRTEEHVLPRNNNSFEFSVEEEEEEEKSDRHADCRKKILNVSDARIESIVILDFLFFI